MKNLSHDLDTSERVHQTSQTGRQLLTRRMEGLVVSGVKPHKHRQIQLQVLSLPGTAEYRTRLSITVFLKPVFGDPQMFQIFVLTQFPDSWEGAKMWTIWGSLRTGSRNTGFLIQLSFPTLSHLDSQLLSSSSTPQDEWPALLPQQIPQQANWSLSQISY